MAVALVLVASLETALFNKDSPLRPNKYRNKIKPSVSASTLPSASISEILSTVAISDSISAVDSVELADTALATRDSPVKPKVYLRSKRPSVSASAVPSLSISQEIIFAVLLVDWVVKCLFESSLTLSRESLDVIEALVLLCFWLL